MGVLWLPHVPHRRHGAGGAISGAGGPHLLAPGGAGHRAVKAEGMVCSARACGCLSFRFLSGLWQRVGWGGGVGGGGGGSVECGLHVEFSITLSCLVSLLRVTLSLSVSVSPSGPPPHPMLFRVLAV